PTLGVAPFDVPGALASPDLTLYSGAGAPLASDAAWGGGGSLLSAFAQTGAFALPAGSADSAVLTTVSAGAYTSQVVGVGSAVGVALAEIYDADTGTPSANLVNISARASVGPGADVLIAGFVVEGPAPTRVLLRGIGPSLGALPFNIPGALPSATIILNASPGGLVAANTGWGNPPTVSTLNLSGDFRQASASDMTAVGAFSIPNGSADSAMVATLTPGAYTLTLSGAGGATGIALVEVYLYP
ncbi:MAG TPA: hypothetical protein VGF85_06675, partial [Opitutaceae bacterium]